MAREIIVLEGNRSMRAVPLRLLFLYRDMPTITTKLDDVVIPTPQNTLDDSAKELLEPEELLELDAGTVAAEEVALEKPAGVSTPEQLQAYLQYVWGTYRVLRDRFVVKQLDRWTLRGTTFDEPG